MSASPFLTLSIRGKKDVILARHRARQVALLLRFPVQEQACIAAGTFAVACRARDSLGRFHLCFQVEDNHLRVYARSVASDVPTSTTAVNRFAAVQEGEGLLRLEKQLPEPVPLALTDLAWLVHNGGGDGSGLFEEVVKQNGEILMLLHELQRCQQALSQQVSPSQPSAA